MKAVNCICGGEPELVTEWMLDLIKCSKCGKEGPVFFDGTSEWLFKAWNQMLEKERKTMTLGHIVNEESN
jgi:hypothetical protein